RGLGQAEAHHPAPVSAVAARAGALKDASAAPHRRLIARLTRDREDGDPRAGQPRRERTSPHGPPLVFRRVPLFVRRCAGPGGGLSPPATWRAAQLTASARARSSSRAPATLAAN